MQQISKINFNEVDYASIKQMHSEGEKAISSTSIVLILFSLIFIFAGKLSTFLIALLLISLLLYILIGSYFGIRQRKQDEKNGYKLVGQAIIIDKFIVEDSDNADKFKIKFKDSNNTIFEKEISYSNFSSIDVGNLIDIEYLPISLYFFKMSKDSNNLLVV